MPSKNDRTGEIAVNTNGSKMKIIKYKNKDDIDVLFIEQNYIKKNGKFKASITINNKAHHLGNYNTSDLAFEAYKQAKEEYIKSKAQEHYDIIPESLYNALMSYEVSKED